jgi:hypothetical protein
MKIWQWVVFVAVLLAIPAGIVLAGHISDGINKIPILVTNTTGSTSNIVQVPFPLSSQTLIDRIYTDANALDTDVREVGHVAFMPGTGQVQMLACFDNAAADETVDCNDAGTDDITLPATTAQVFEFAADNQFRHLWINTSTATDADWTVTWQYWNGSAYTAFSGVTDGTNGFTTAGLNRVSWSFPTAGLWPQSTLHAVAGYWVRAEVTAFTSITVAPLGQQAWYETGRWWTFAESIGATEQKRYDAHLATGTQRTFHYYFPNAAGTSTADEAGMEPGTSTWEIEVNGYIDATAPVSGSDKKILFKDNAIEITIPGEGIIQAQIYEAP